MTTANIARDAASPRPSSRRVAWRRLRFAAGVVGTLALAVAAACDATPTSVEYLAVDRFDEVWTRYDLAYPAFAFRTVDWDAARARWRPVAETASTPASLAAVVRQLLAELQDRQAAVVSPEGNVFRAYTTSRVPNFERERWRAALAGSGYTSRNGGNWGTALLAGIPYVFVDEWDDGGGESFLEQWDLAFDALRDAPALVLDLRSANAGDEFVAFQAIGRLTDVARTAGFTRIRERGRRDSLGVFVPRALGTRPRTPFLRPVVALIGRGTYATTESVVSALRTLPNVVLVGDTTLGSAGGPELRPLASGWSYSIQRWTEYTADREPIESRGIAPDEVVPWTPSPAEPSVDPLLAYALARARALAESAGAR